MTVLHNAFGLLGLLLLAWLVSERRKAVNWRTVCSGMALALVLGAAFRWLPGVSQAVESINAVLDVLLAATRSGTALVFGHLGGGATPYEPVNPAAGFVLATQALPLLLVISALSALLFHWGILTRIVQGFAWILQRTMGIGGAVGVSAAANAFVGMVEGPLVVRPWLNTLSRGELFMTMTCGMATIAGTVLVLYATILRPVMPQAMAHLLAASVIAIPVALAVAALMVPSESSQQPDRLALDREDPSAMAAIGRGTTEGLQLLLSIVAMLIVFSALVYLVNAALGMLPAIGGAPLSAERILGFVFAPIAWMTGVPWSEAITAGQLLGKKTALNELVAYIDMAALPAEALSERSRLLMTYALAGFANFGSAGIMIGGLGALMPPERRAEVGHLCMKSIAAGLLSSCITAALMGLLY